MSTLKSKIRAGTLPETTVRLCLHGELQARYEAVERRLEQAKANKPPAGARRLDSASPLREADAELEQLREQMAEHVIELRLRALPRPKFRALIEEHQPRQSATGDVDERDKYIGVNTATFFDPLIRACVVDDLDAEDWRVLLEEKLTDAQYDVLADAAWAINRRDVDVPFSPAASPTSRSSAPG